MSNYDKIDEKLDRIIKTIVDINQRLASVEHNMATKPDINDLANTLDGMMSQFDVENSEIAAAHSRMDRHEKYIEVLADKAGVNLDAIHGV